MLKSLCAKNKCRNNTIHDENQYLNLISDIIEHGTYEEGRNGNTKVVFGSAMHFSLENGQIPLLTTKRLAHKTCLKELLWFIKGDTNNKHLKDQKVHIWDANGSREFLDSRGLKNQKEDDMGPIYGFQWRHFNAPYTNCDADYSNKGYDQLQNIIDILQCPEVRMSRRLVMSSWNPLQLEDMALPPCHILAQFNVTDNNKLHCALYQRSGDVGLGVPFNIASYSFLTHLLAKHCGLEAADFSYFVGNTHIYDDHISILQTQIDRTPKPFPILEINKLHSNINDYKIEDFNVTNYEYHPKLPMTMRK
jgi:thymidylate synthase